MTMQPVHISAQHKLVGVPVTGQLAVLFPDAKRATFAGSDLILLNHGIDETRLLRNLGHDVPAPILTHYEWANGTPFEVQRKTAALLTMNTRAYVLNGMGTGKTKAALWSWDYLYKRGEVDKLLVVAPLSTLNFTWAREIFQTLPGVQVQVLHGTKARRLQRLDDRMADIYVVNHDGVATIWDELSKRKDINALVLDELAVYRNPSSQKVKLARKLAAGMKYAWGMTGSPTPNEPTDAWAQCTILTPSTVPKYFNRFRDDTMTKINQFKFIPKPGALDKVFEVMQPAVRYTLDDVVELPDLVERIVEVEMGAHQAKVYKQMQDHAAVAVANHTITAMNAGAVLSKLLQISTGMVYTRDRTIVPLDNEGRIRAMLDAVAATNEKVIVFVPFTHALHAVAEALTSEGYETRIVSGATPKPERDETFNLFQNSSGIKVLCAHPKCMSHGLTLTAATTIIWFAPTTSLEIFEQANARIRRIGQTHRQQILMFQSTKVERQLYARLRAKQKVQNLLLDMFATATEEY